MGDASVQHVGYSCSLQSKTDPESFKHYKLYRDMMNDTKHFYYNRIISHDCNHV